MDTHALSVPAMALAATIRSTEEEWNVAVQKKGSKELAVQ